MENVGIILGGGGVIIAFITYAGSMLLTQLKIDYRNWQERRRKCAGD